MIVQDWRSEVAPGQTRTAEGELVIGGVGARTLAQRFGTPLFVIDLDVVDAAVATFAGAAGDAVDVTYAAKAFFCVALARHLAPSGVHFDVCSLGELATAERAGITPDRLVFHGCGKNDAELRAIAAGRVRFPVVDNVAELDALAALAERPLDVVIRINPGIETRTHAYVRTSGENTKFGIPLGDLEALFARLREHERLRTVGVHAHVGSQIDDADAFAANLETLVAVADRARASGLPIDRVIAGGGFAVEARPGLEVIDPAHVIAQLRARLDGTPYRLGVEPGRALVARGGTSLYSVMAIKRAGNRRFVVVDGGIADNPRPALYGAYHHPLVAGSNAHHPPAPATICGRSCENDELVESDLPDDLAAGDLVALCTTGAYTFAMASNYNRFGRPGVVFTGGGEARLAVARENVDDVLRRDLE